MNSMTGFGKAELITKDGKFTIEATSVNNRFLEVSARLPRAFSIFEAKVKKLVNSMVSRGKISLWVGYEESNDSPDKFLINIAALKAYYNQLSEFKAEMKLSGQVEISDLLQLPDIARPEKEAINELAIWPSIEKTLLSALKQLIIMRGKEGAAMKKDMSGRLTKLAACLKDVSLLSANYVEVYRDKLKRRIDELIDSASIDNGRLEEEIAIFAEKADITEECTRLASHIKQYRQVLKLAEPVGKKLNFILQEMNREANTIASKSSDFDVSSVAIMMKDEIEKLRELAQNVE